MMTDNELWLTITALNSAAERWTEWSMSIALPDVAETFALQANEARALAVRLADADTIKIFE